MSQNSRWAFVASLGADELMDLHQHVMVALSRHNQTWIQSDQHPTSDYGSDQSMRSAFSTILEMHQSSSSIPQRESISTGTIAPSALGEFYQPEFLYPAQVPIHIQNQNDTRSWPNTQCLNHSPPVLPSFSSSKTQSQWNESNPMVKLPDSPVLLLNGPTKLPYFCPSCAERGAETKCKTKQDWKRHQQDFHDTGNEWRCRVSGCSKRFLRQVEFKKHHNRIHREKGCLQERKEIVQLRRVYACGFKNCRTIAYTWNSFSDHVAEDIQKGYLDWDYSRTIKNLLGHPDLELVWERVRTQLCTLLGFTASNLKWNLTTTSQMREQLQCLNFGGDLEGFLKRIFLAGCPAQQLADSSAYQPGYMLPAPAPVTPSLRSQDTFIPYDHSYHCGLTFLPSDDTRFATQSLTGNNNTQITGQSASDGSDIQMIVAPVVAHFNDTTLEVTNPVQPSQAWPGQQSTWQDSTDALTYLSDTSPNFSRPFRQHANVK